MNATQAAQESLSGAHAPMSKVFPGAIATAPGTRNAYVTADGGVVAMMVGDEAQERAEAVARAIAAHDKLVAMLLSLRSPRPSPSGWLSAREWQEAARAGPGSIVVTSAPAESSADPDYAEVGPYVVDDISIAIGSAVRRRNRSHRWGEQPIASSMEYAATDLVLQALAETGYKVIPPGQESTADSADHLCTLALAEVLAECDKVRAELKATGHASEGQSLSRLVDAAIERERTWRKEAQDRLEAVRVAAA